MRTFIAFLGLGGLTALVAPARAFAQDLGSVRVEVSSVAGGPVCAPGRVAGPETAGRCCWPGQRWSDDEARCEGVAQCPSGWGGDGNGCAPLGGGMSEAGFRALPRVRPSPLIPLREGEPVAEGARVVRLRSNWLIATGAVIFTSTYVVSFGVGAAGAAQCNNSYGSCYLWTWMIPIVGPALSPAVAHNVYDVSGLLAAGLMVSASEFIGAALFAYGFRHHSYLLYAGDEGRQGVRFALLPGAAGAQAGLTLAVTGF